MNPTPAAFARALDAAFVGEFGVRNRYLVERGGKTWTADGVTLDESTWIEHVLGKIRVGAIQPADRTLYAAIDLDGKRRGTSDPDPERLAEVRELIPRLVRFAREQLLVELFVELTRSGCGYRVGMLFSEDDAPTQGEARLFLRGLLCAFDLPDDGAEGAGHPGIFPRAPGAESVGGTVFAPLGGICNGARASRFVDPEALEPVEDQLGALLGAERHTRDDLHGALDALVTRLEERGIRPPSEEAVTVYARAAESPAGAVDHRDFLAEVIEIAEKLGAIAHGRNPAAFAAAARLGNRIGAGQGTVETAEPALLEAMHRNGFATDPRPAYGERAALKTLHRGFRKGMTTPRPYPEPGPACVVDVTEAPSALEEPDWIRDERDSDHGPMAATIPVVEDTTAEPEAGEADETEAPVLSAYDGPVLPEECWRFGFREFREAISPTTEAADAFLFGGALVAFGAMLGRSARLDIGQEVFANFYAVSVGESGDSRKTSAMKPAVRAMERVDEGVRIIPGIGSPEGLLDELAPSETVTGPKGNVVSIRTGERERAVVTVNELSTLLRKASAEATRGLGPMLLTLYDCPYRYKIPNRRTKVEAREPFLSLLAGATAEGLRRDMTEDDVHGGFANRFLFLVGPTKPPIPIPPPPDAEAVVAFEAILRSVRDAHACDTVYAIDPEARALYEAWYLDERSRPYPSPVLGVLSKRLHLHAWKLALVYAAVEGTRVVTGPQMMAALAFVNYQRKAHAFVFEGYGETTKTQLERRILRAIAKHGALPVWRLRTVLRNVAVEDINRTVDSLHKGGVLVPISLHRKEKGRPAGRGFALRGGA